VEAGWEGGGDGVVHDADVSRTDIYRMKNVLGGKSFRHSKDAGESRTTKARRSRRTSEMTKSALSLKNLSPKSNQKVLPAFRSSL